MHVGTMMSFPPPPEAGWGGPRVLCETRSPSPQYARCNARVLGSWNVIISLQKQKPSHLFSSLLSSYQRFFTSAHVALLPPSLSSLMSFLRLFRHNLYSRLSGGALHNLSNTG